VLPAPYGVLVIATVPVQVLISSQELSPGLESVNIVNSKFPGQLEESYEQAPSLQVPTTQSSPSQQWLFDEHPLHAALTTPGAQPSKKILTSAKGGSALRLIALTTMFKPELPWKFAIL
jgi:hypothetical protein